MQREIEITLGKTTQHLATAPGQENVLIHSEMQEPLRLLGESATLAGFDCKLASGFRSFDRQLLIWNEKATGERPVFGQDGKILDIQNLSSAQRLHAILRWSALPGASRHHWGTDFDVYDGLALPPGGRVELTPEEAQPSGIFGKFHLWLDQNLEKFGFFRPYGHDRGGVAPERWHISHRILSSKYQNLLTPGLLYDTLKATDIQLKEDILANLPALFKRYCVLG